MELLGAIVTLIGSLFLFLGAVGIFRMPDVYNRMQAGTKATTLGSILFLIGIGVGHYECGCLGKLILLIMFIIFTNPISSNALARAAHFAGVKLTKLSVKDDLAEDGLEKGEEK
ncbi:MAG: monovalent cation/H(+) antiporter subunit G [Candidatus Tenebribacter davisii]|jgi:multicomponent Na+:H+ antiporter subunit G|nr:monovalent cation/H(+) antiporter subunit G [Candidatus Tenebribacter davisii]